MSSVQRFGLPAVLQVQSKEQLHGPCPCARGTEGVLMAARLRSVGDEGSCAEGL